jgi:hypothetical protein
MELRKGYTNNLQYIDYSHNDLVTRELWWQKANLQYTASGYGGKIPTSKMLRVGKRLYRVYCAIYSNNGSCYIVKGKNRIYLGFEKD